MDATRHAVRARARSAGVGEVWLAINDGRYTSGRPVAGLLDRGGWDF